MAKAPTSLGSGRVFCKVCGEEIPMAACGIPTAYVWDNGVVGCLACMKSGALGRYKAAHKAEIERQMAARMRPMGDAQGKGGKEGGAS